MSTYLNDTLINYISYNNNVVKYCYYNDHLIYTCGTVIGLTEESNKTITLPNSFYYEDTCVHPTADGNHILIVGGTKNDYCSSEVTAFDKSLTKISATAFSRTTYGTRASAVGNYVVFAGGYYNTTDGDYSTNVAHKVVNAYNNSLTRTVMTSLTYALYNFGIGSVGNFIVITGGIDWSSGEADNTKTYCTTYNSSLTKGSVTPLDSMFERFIDGRANTPNSLHLINSREVMVSVSSTLTLSSKTFSGTLGTVRDMRSAIHNDKTIVSINDDDNGRLLYSINSSGTIAKNSALNNIAKNFNNYGTSLLTYKISEDNYATIFGGIWCYNEKNIGIETGRQTALTGNYVHILGDHIFTLNSNKVNFYKISYTI